MKPDDVLTNEIQRMGPIALGSEIWPHLDMALLKADQLGGPQRLVVRGNAHILGNIIEPNQVARLIECCRLRWRTRGSYP
jgi:hypothetical protein